MKFTLHLFLVVLSVGCQAQEQKLLIRKDIINDWSQYPIYPRLIDASTKSWKSQYKYLDSINVFGITYLSDGLKVHGLLAEPKSPGKYPCIIYNRGGNRDFGALVAAHGAMTLGKIAQEGYVVIASQYRGNAGGEGQEEFGGKDVNDVLNLIEVLKEVKTADSENIGMYGWSRGGMMTYIALTKTDRIKAAVVGGANADLTQINRPKMEEGVYAELIPDYWNKKDEALKARSAIHWVDKFPSDVPILLLHGNADWRVKSTHSLNLALAFEEHRIPYRLKIYDGADHGISEFNEERDADVLDWFDRFLKRKEALPQMEYHGK